MLQKIRKWLIRLLKVKESDIEELSEETEEEYDEEEVTETRILTSEEMSDRDKQINKHNWDEV